jgi:hypothetical protein
MGKYSRIRYWNSIPNNGDAITSFLVRQIMNSDPVLSEGDQPHVLGVGSIFFMATPSSYIWGSGILDPTSPVPPFDVRKVRGLRGKLTRDLLRKNGFEVPDVPLGDPGVLVSRLSQCAEWRRGIFHGERRQFRAAIVPHWTTFEFTQFDKYRRSAEIALVDMRDNTLAPLQQICCSEVVLSQSLHGLIYAEALGIPTLWWTDKKSDASVFKYNDWYSNVRNAPRDPVMLDQITDAWFRLAELREIGTDDWEMIANFPRAEVSFEYDSQFLGFETCRRWSPHFIVCDELFQAQSGLLNHEVPEETAATSKLLRRILTNTYRYWGERPFTCVAATSWVMRLDVIERLVTFMHRHHEIDIVFLAKESDDNLQICASGTRLTYRGHDYFAEVGIMEEMVIIRPSASGSITRKIATTILEDSSH